MTSNGNGHHVNETLAMSNRLAAAGISHVPTGPDKMPFGRLLPINEETGKPGWKPLQERHPTESERKGWYGGDTPQAGIAVVHGTISGHLETIDFDEDAEWVFAQWCGLVEDVRPGLLAKLIQVKTPGDGMHVRYRCVEAVDGNQPLAHSDKKHDDGKPKIRVETRGEGGYAVHPGTLAKFHPSNRLYEQLAGPPLWEPSVISKLDREVLFSAARAFDMKPYEPEQERKAGASKYEATPWDDFNQRTDWETLLGDHGWAHAHDEFWKHPSAEARWSASVNFCGNDLLHNFSTNSGLPLNKSMTRFAFVAFLDYQGDFRRASEDLFAKGYGKLKVKPGNRQDAPPAPWGEPKPLPSGIPDVAPFDYDLLPQPFVAWVKDAAERTQAPADYVACASMVSLAAVVGRRMAIRPKRYDDWTVISNLWGFAVGPPGVMKTQAVQQGFAPLTMLEIRAEEKHVQAMKEFAAQEILNAARKTAAKKQVEKALQNGDPGRARELAEHAVLGEVEPPQRRRYMVSDATVEKLGEILSANPFGVAVVRDEIPGFLKSLDREGQEPARAFYLEAWNGDGRFVYDRIGRGTVTIPNVCVSIFGSIQPGPLGDYQRSAIRNGCDADGLLQRFQLACWPDVTKEWRNVDRWPDSEAKSIAYSVFTMLEGVNADHVGAKHDENDPEGIPHLRFDDEAQEAFDVWRGALEPRLRGDAEHSSIIAHLAKYRSLVPSLALLIHLAEAETFGAVGLPSLGKAMAWAKYLESHARRIFAASVGSDIQGARSIADKIIEGALADGFTCREVYQRHWAGLTSKEDVEDAVGLLIDLNWLRERTEKTGGRPNVRHEINPAVCQKSSQV